MNKNKRSNPSLYYPRMITCILNICLISLKQKEISFIDKEFECKQLMFLVKKLLNFVACHIINSAMHDFFVQNNSQCNKILSGKQFKTWGKMFVNKTIRGNASEYSSRK